MKKLLVMAVISFAIASAQAQTDVNYDDPNMKSASSYVSDTIDDGFKASDVSEATYIVQSPAFAADFATASFRTPDDGLIHPDGRMPASNETSFSSSSASGSAGSYK